MNTDKEQYYKEQLTRAVNAIRKLKSELNETKNQVTSSQEPIAIVGMGCRFASKDQDGNLMDIETLNDFWDLLKNEINAVSPIPETRWDVEKYYNSEPFTQGKMNVKTGSHLQNADKFDNNYFNISPKEALYIEPQHRLILEITCEALENAGIKFDDLHASNTSVYVGLNTVGWEERHLTAPNSDLISPYSVSGSLKSTGSGRISYFLQTHGENMAIDTGCSASLVAVHLACQNLQLGLSDIGIAGGVNMVTSPKANISLSLMGGLAPDGQCKTFDESANGFGRGDGCGVVILKRLSDAQKDGDFIHAVIRGTAVNQDGKSNGLTAPNGTAQEMVIHQALKMANLKPDDISYIEAHGTGTPVGDPLELQALHNVFLKRKKPLWVGSVKTNFGHTEGAAGTAGIIKTALAMQQKKLPANLHFNTPTPHIDWENTSLKVPTKMTDWKQDTLRAGVSGFGMGGTNAHVILEEAPQTEKITHHSENQVYILPLSAKTPQALKNYAQKYIQFIENSDADLLDICANASLKRTHFSERLTAFGNSKIEILNQLKAYVEDLPEIQKIDTEEYGSKIAFIFSGQGAQWVGMGRELYEKEPVFKQNIDEWNTAFQKYVEWDLVEELNRPESETQFNEMDVIQPVLVAVYVAIAKLWESQGIKAQAVIGHSMGEAGSAYFSGALSLEDVVKVICLRSQLLKKIAGKGAMAVVGLTVSECEKLIVGKEKLVSIAVSNSANSTVLSGEPKSIDEILEKLEKQDIFCKKINVTVASHSPQTDEIKEELHTLLRDIKPQKSKIPFYSTVREDVVSGENLNADYWADNLREPVLFSSTLAQMLEDEYNFFIEVSPHSVLKVSGEQVIETQNNPAKIISSLKRNTSEISEFYRNFGQLYNSGFPLDWKEIYSEKYNFVHLPTYPWQKKSFWLPNAFDEVDSSAFSFSEPEIEEENSTQKSILEQLSETSKSTEKQEITQLFLKRKVGNITGYASSQIEPTANFKQLGVDSMMIVKLRGIIQEELKIDFSASDFWEMPTVVEFSEFLVNKLGGLETQKTDKNSADLWLVRHKPNPNAKLKLFCFHYAAGSDTMYFPWKDKISPEVELICVQFAGRGSRISEPCLTDIDSFLTEFLPIFKNEIDRPFALFGHSMGGIIAFELARKLRQEHLQKPEHLFVSASNHPKFRPEKTWYNLPENELTAVFTELDKEAFNDDEFYNKMVTAMRSDLQIIETSVYYDESPFDFPITAFYSPDDKIVLSETIDAWRGETQEKLFDKIEQKGGHYFIDEDPDNLIRFVNKKLKI